VFFCLIKSSTQNFLAELLLKALFLLMPLAFIELPLADFPVWLLLVLVVVGLLCLTFGGDWLTKGAAAISVILKISPVVVGLTVVSMATSMPELVTSLLAAGESPGLAIGNILGSNVANISLILGITALFSPLAIQLRLIRREVPILIAVTVLFSIFALGGFTRGEGAILLGLTIAYLAYVVRGAKSEPEAVNAEFLEEVEEASHTSVGMASWLVVVGAVLLALGADALVGSSVELASRMGVSDALIGITIVAVGTSLPELAASVAAARAGHSDICAGNIVGSNLFNLLLIGGCVASLVPFPVDSSLFKVEFPAVILLTSLLLWFFKTGHVVSRREGAVLLVLYLGILSLSALSQLGYLF
jgi:cation:H+ antiporter